jgi:serine/threonine protein kinase/tetratricopeptide (TPR) repeat protein
MGTVYEAFQTSLKRTVAVKVLGQQVSASPTAVIRFQREAQAAAKLNHAHIVPIFALGENDGTFFYAMEFVDGPGLNDIIGEHRERQTTDTATSVLSDSVELVRSGASVAQAARVDVAETQPLPPRQSIGDSSVTLSSFSNVHSSNEFYSSIARHIANVADGLHYAHKQGVIHRDVKPHNLILGRDENLRISDFGLARLSEQPGVTVTGELIGSPLYMSPEQLTGKASAVDHRTDIYSLGATLYEWMTLSPPYPGDTRERVISQILTSEPVTPRAVNTEIPIDLETICLKAMERDIHQRYQHAGEMRDDLIRFVEKQPIFAKRSSAATRLRKFVGRHQLASLATVTAVLALVLTVALVSTSRAVKTQTAVAEQALADQSKLVDMFGELKEMLPPELGGTLSAIEAMAPVLKGLVESTESNTDDDASSPPTGANPARAAQVTWIARRAVWDFYQDTHHANDEEPTPADDVAAHVAQAMELATTDPKAALDMVNAVLNIQPNNIQGRLFRTALRGRLGRFDKMLDDADALIRFQPSDALAFAWRGLAHLLIGLGNRSIADLKQAIEKDPSSPWAPAIYGLAIARDDRSLEAISAYDDALDRNPDLIVARLGRAASRAALGNLSGAVTDLTLVLELEPDNADVLALRGDYYVAMKDFAAAEKDFDQAMVIAGRTPMMIMRYMGAYSQQRRDPSKPGAIQSKASNTPMTITPDIRVATRAPEHKKCVRALGLDRIRAFRFALGK